MPTPKSPKGVTVSPKGTETVHLKHQHAGRHQEPEWKRQQKLEEERDAEEIEKLAAGELSKAQHAHVLSSETGEVVRGRSREAQEPPAVQGDKFDGEWNWDMARMDRQRATQERHDNLLQDVDELGSQLDALESKIQQVPTVPNLNANDFLDIITGHASEAALEFNKKNVVILKKCREIRAGRAKIDKELAKKKLLIQKVAEASQRLVEAEARSQLSDASDDVSQLRDLLKDAKRKVDEVQFAVSQRERQLATMEQAVKVEIFGHDQNPKRKEKAEKFNVYSLVDPESGTVKRLGKTERIQKLKKEKRRLVDELKQLAAQDAKEEAQSSSTPDVGPVDGVADSAPELSEEQLTEQVQAKSKTLKKLKTVLAATKARITALGNERAKNVAQIVSLIEDSDAHDAQVNALQEENRGLQARLNQQRHKMEAAREEESSRERANLRALTESLEHKIDAKKKQVASVRLEVERQELELEDAKKGLSQSSASQQTTKSTDARAMRALQVENQRLGERLQMLESAIEEKAVTVESVCETTARIRKENRSLEKKLSKLQVKRTRRGSSRETLDGLRQQIEAERATTAELVDSFRQRLAAKQDRVLAYREEAESYRQQINTQQGQRPPAYDDVMAENAALKRRLAAMRAT